METVVLKIGGSLLTLPDLPQRIEQLISTFDACHVLAVVGGGAAADVVRDWDRTHRLNAEVAHRLAVGAMRQTARLVAGLVSRACLVNDRDTARDAWQRNEFAILEPQSIMDTFEHECRELPHDWTVTSDSIAAWLSIRWPAERLVLVKSIDPPLATDWQHSVDAYFPVLLPKLRQLEWVNLRRRPSERVAWQIQS